VNKKDEESLTEYLPSLRAFDEPLACFVTDNSLEHSNCPIRVLRLHLHAYAVDYTTLHNLCSRKEPVC